MTHIFDISRSISAESLVYPGDDPLIVEPLCSIAPSCPCNITRLGWTTHFLTHVDVPLHFIENGASLDDVSLTRFFGIAEVIEIEADVVEPDHFSWLAELRGVSILFKTRNSASWGPAFNPNHVYISAEAAELAVKRGVNMVGIDYLSVDKFGDESYPAHRILLSGNVLVLEGLDLSAVAPGRYTLSALPLRISRGDGSPVRAILYRSN